MPKWITLVAGLRTTDAAISTFHGAVKTQFGWKRPRSCGPLPVRQASSPSSPRKEPNDQQTRGTPVMMKSVTGSTIVGIAIGAAFLLPGWLASNPTQVSEPPVYHPERLMVIKSSIVVEGVVASQPTRQSDGDATFELRAGTEQYHAEIVCVYPPAFKAAQDACRGYQNHIPIPRASAHVRVTGPLVRDLRHDEQFHELEIHPVTNLIVLP